MKKLKIIVNAYACAPNMGSEQGMAWNWCTHLAKYSELFILTESEYREEIEKAINDFEFKENLHFYYIPVTERVRAMCKNQGDWRFYYFYEKWQRKALHVAKKIISEHKIDILHQLNMIGYREPGYLWKIEDIPFVWGPIGGLHLFPTPYLKGASIKTKLYFYLKNFLNKIQIKFSRRVSKAIHRADLLISATPDSYNMIKKHKKKTSIHIPDQGSFSSHLKFDDKRFYDKLLQVMWVGKFDFGKQLNLAIKTIAYTKNENIILNVYGKGSKKQVESANSLIKRHNLTEQVKFHGFKSKSEIEENMQKADLFFFTSVSEGTPTVILEALSNHLPILCFDTCGFGVIVDDSIGVKLPISKPEISIIDFAKHLNIFHENRNLLKTLSDNCQNVKKNYYWQSYSQKVLEQYHRILNFN